MAWWENLTLGDVGKYGGSTVGALGTGAGYQTLHDVNQINKWAAQGYGPGNKVPQHMLKSLTGAYVPNTTFEKLGYGRGSFKDWLTKTIHPDHFKPVQTVMKAAQSPFGKAVGSVGRFAFGIPGLVASTPFLAKSGIDALTKRDPNATESSLFGIDLTKNANEQAALPESELQDWGSTMGVIPGDDLPNPLPKVYPGSAYSPHRGFEEMQFDETVQAPAKKGFSFNPLDWGVMGLAKKMIEPNTPEENFGRKYFENTMDSSGRVYNDPEDLFGGKNVVSAWGQGMGAAGQKRIDTIENTLQNKYGLSDEEIEDVYAGSYRGDVNTQLIQRLQNFKNQQNIYNKNLAAATGGADTTGGAITTGNVVTTATNPNLGDPASRDQGGGYSTRGGFTGTRSTAGPRGTSTPASGRGHHSWAQGGRVGLRMGGDPTGWMTEPENVTPFQLQQEEGVPMGLMASDDVNTRILENLFEKYLDLGFSPAEAERLAMEEFESMAQGPQEEVVEEGIASLV